MKIVPLTSQPSSEMITCGSRRRSIATTRHKTRSTAFQGRRERGSERQRSKDNRWPSAVRLASGSPRRYGQHVVGSDFTEEDHFGYGADLFPTTSWGGIDRARDRSLPALSHLCEQYHPPLLIYLRRRGLGPDEAADLAQGFFTHLLEREFLAGVGPGQGRFRAFLIACLQNFLRDDAARARALKRGGNVPHVSLSLNARGRELVEHLAVGDLPPDLAYERAWAQRLFGAALDSWRQEQIRRHGEYVTEAIEQVMYRDTDAPAFQELADHLGVSRDAVKMKALRLRQRLAWWIRHEVRETLAEGEDVEEELRHLIRMLKSP